MFGFYIEVPWKSFWLILFAQHFYFSWFGGKLRCSVNKHFHFKITRESIQADDEFGGQRWLILFAKITSDGDDVFAQAFSDWNEAGV